MAERPYLDYYIKNKIIPVKQNIDDLALHFRRREMLYHFLQIPSSVIRGRKVIEFGPGTGDNATYTASLAPAMYQFVDGNPYSLAALRERVADPRYRFRSIPELRITESDALKYEDSERYDVVLCEGVIPGQNDGKGFLRHIAQFAETDGMVVVTTQSATSMLSEVCRHLVKPVFARQASSREELCDALEAFFAPHLATLPGRSRIARDWVNDNILQPWPASLIFTIEDAIDAIGEEFDFFGSSPRFLQDFRWYKAAAVDGLTVNDIARRQAAAWSPVLLDYRVEPASLGDFDGAALERECLGILVDVHEAWTTDDIAQCRACIDRIARLSSSIEPALPRAAGSIRDFVKGMETLIKSGQADFGDFASWFGRGQQYVSFVRRRAASA